jgi:effector-binding domain-containing protein
MNTAKIIALVSLIINAIYFIRVLYVIYTGGFDGIEDAWNEVMEELKKNS